MKRTAFLTLALALMLTVIAGQPARAKNGGTITLDRVRETTDAYDQVNAA